MLAENNRELRPHTAHEDTIGSLLDDLQQSVTALNAEADAFERQTDKLLGGSPANAAKQGGEQAAPATVIQALRDLRRQFQAVHDRLHGTVIRLEGQL